MNRIVPGPYAVDIWTGLSVIPQPILDRVLPTLDFLTGTDPVWAGLHDDAIIGYLDIEDASFPAMDTAHFCSREGQTVGALVDRRRTIVLPSLSTTRWDVVVHEFGHALEDYLEDAGLKWDKTPSAVTDYAHTTPQEAFAEFFMTWVCGPQELSPHREAWEAVLIDREARAFFDALL